VPNILALQHAVALESALAWASLTEYGCPRAQIGVPQVRPRDLRARHNVLLQYAVGAPP
jgi:hypothetical protein